MSPLPVPRSQMRVLVDFGVEIGRRVIVAVGRHGSFHGRIPLQFPNTRLRIVVLRTGARSLIEPVAAAHAGPVEPFVEDLARRCSARLGRRRNPLRPLGLVVRTAAAHAEIVGLARADQILLRTHRTVAALHQAEEGHARRIVVGPLVGGRFGRPRVGILRHQLGILRRCVRTLHRVGACGVRIVPREGQRRGALGIEPYVRRRRGEILTLLPDTDVAELAVARHLQVGFTQGVQILRIVDRDFARAVRLGRNHRHPFGNIGDRPRSRSRNDHMYRPRIAVEQQRILRHLESDRSFVVIAASDRRRGPPDAEGIYQ